MGHHSPTIMLEQLEQIRTYLRGLTQRYRDSGCEKDPNTSHRGELTTTVFRLPLFRGAGVCARDIGANGGRRAGSSRSCCSTVEIWCLVDALFAPCEHRGAELG
jgi:hypothetical protein